MRNETSGEQSWQTLLLLFPRKWRALAEETGANRRPRSVPSLEALIRTLLLHLARGYALHETVVVAKAVGVAELSAVALFKRLQKAEDWFKELCWVLLPLSGVAVPADTKAVRLRLVDSTLVKEPGKTGRRWRIQYSFQLPAFGCDYFGLHPGKGVLSGVGFSQGVERITSREGWQDRATPAYWDIATYVSELEGARSCQKAVYQWTEVVTKHLPHLSKPQAAVLALWSVGMVLTHS